MPQRLSGHIGDGYTISAYIAPVPRLYPSLRFKFRPMLGTARSRLLFDNDGLQPDKSALNTATALHKHLVSWNLKDVDTKGNEKDVKPSPQAIMRMLPALQG